MIVSKNLETKRRSHFWGVSFHARCRGAGNNQTGHHSLLAAARGGNAIRRITSLSFLLSGWPGMANCYCICPAGLTP